MQKYLARIADSLLQEALEAAGAVLIEGPKWCGKTRTASECAASEILMQDPDKSESYLFTANTKPSLLLEGAAPRLIDEWQDAPVLWDAVRFAVDQRHDVGQFILTGSTVVPEKKIRHSGAGRISRLKMRTMSLYESLESNGSVSLKALFDGTHDISGTSSLSIEKIAFAIARGGWPMSISLQERAALKQARDYTEAIINVDTSKVDGIAKNPAYMRLLLRSLSRNTATVANMSTIKDDMASDEDTISVNTIAIYINALRRLFVVEDLPAWSPSLRSKTAIRTSPKRHFTDPSIAAAALRLSPESLLGDFKLFGFLFESLCTRDLRVYSQALDGEVFHYRDRSGLEADAVIYLNDGRWAAVEVKMGSMEIEEAARHLLILADKIDQKKMQAPSFLMVLTATEFAYRRDDGVLVVPIGCLKA